MVKKDTLFDIPTIKRWKADRKYVSNPFVNVTLSGFVSTEKSLTDKEAYRVNLATLRGTLASGLGSPTVGQYSIPAGEKYDPNKDFSYLNRPDVSLVDLHEYIEEMRESLEKYDDNMRIKIQNEIEQAEKKAKELEKAELAKAEKKGPESE